MLNIKPLFAFADRQGQYYEYCIKRMFALSVRIVGSIVFIVNSYANIDSQIPVSARDKNASDRAQAV